MFWRLITLVVVLGVSTIVFSFVYPLSPGTGVRTPIRIESDDITVGWVGDMVPSLDPSYNNTAFAFVGSALREPDLMIGNLEGTFADESRTSKCVYLLTRCHAFRGDASFATHMKAAGFDFVSLVNNHSYDYGEDGLKDTVAVLDAVGLPSITSAHPTATITIKGKTIGILGLSSTEPARTITDYDFIRSTVAALKNENDFVIVIFHGGTEGSDKTAVPGVTEYMGTEDRGNVQLVAHTAIDAGADLVLGSGPHVLRKIETYNGKTIAYSLGNFVGGNGKLVTKGTLGISGILTATLTSARPSPYTVTSVLLTPNGTPALDLSDQGRTLIESLSQ